jgi:ABC-2 type transport system permease protein
MAVYKRSYKSYSGRLTPDWARFLTLTKYSLETLFQSRLVIGFIVACYLFPIVSAVMIYLQHNTAALALLRVDATNILRINSDFFAVFLSAQGVFAFLFTAYAGPGLISPDLSNNALPLYLCRPISRTEYVLGKMAVLFIPLSCITWIPGLILYGLQAGLEGGGWGVNNWRYAWGIFGGSWVWIVLLSLLALALSAWVKWRLAASALLFGTFFLSAAFSEIINEVLRTKAGNVFNLGYVIGVIWAKMLDVGPRATMLGELFDIKRGGEIPHWQAWFALGIVSAVCILLLNRKLRGREVSA